MAKIDSLLSRASEVRDATLEKENTALRVGSLFVDLIQTITAVLPREILEASGISVAASASDVTISYKKILNDGSAGTGRITIPAVTETGAGVITPALLAQIREGLTDISEAIRAAGNAQTSADTANNTAANNTALIKQLQGCLEVAAWMVRSVAAGADDPEYIRAKIRRLNLWSSDTAESDIVLARGATEEAAGAMTAQHVKDLKLAKGFMATKGKAYGLAPLDADKHVPDENIAPKFFDVLMFDSVVYEEVTVSASSSTLGYGDEGAAIVYSSKLDRFLLKITQAGVLKPTYCNNFRGSERYGTLGLDGVCPVEGKIYIEGERGYPYVWYDLMLFHIDHYAWDLVDALESTKGRAEGIAPLDANTMIPAEHIPATFRNVAHFAEVIDSKPGAVSPGTAPGAVGDDEVDVVFCEATKRFLFRHTPADGLGRFAYFYKIDGWQKLGESSDENGVIPSAGKLYVNDKQGDALYWHGNALRPIRPAIKESDDIHTTIANTGTAGQSVQLNLTEAARKSVFCDLFSAAAGTAGYAKFTNGLFDCKLNGLPLSYNEAVLIYNVTNGVPATEGFCNPDIRTNLWNTSLGYCSGPADDKCPVMLFHGCKNIEVIRFNGWVTDPRLMFGRCEKLTKVIGGFIGDGGWPKNPMPELFPHSPLITSFKLERLQKDVSFANNPLIDLDSWTYMVEHRTTFNTNQYTVIVHPDVYAKLTGDTTNEAAAALTAEELSQWQALLTKAAGKNIAFASA